MFPVSPIKDLTRTRSAQSGDFKLNRYLDVKHKEILESVVVRQKSSMHDAMRISRPRTAAAAILSGARALGTRQSVYSRQSEPNTPIVQRRALKKSAKTDSK